MFTSRYNLSFYYYIVYLYKEYFEKFLHCLNNSACVKLLSDCAHLREFCIIIFQEKLQVRYRIRLYHGSHHYFKMGDMIVKIIDRF